MKNLSITIAILCFSLNARALITGTWRVFSNTTTPTCMIEDKPYLWIGTDDGLVKFDTRTDTFAVISTSNSNLPQGWIYRLAKDKDGGIWAVLPGNGAARYANNSWTSFSPSLPSNNGDDVAVDSLGRVWIATDGGLAKYDHGSWTTYTTSNSPLTNNSIYGVACDKANHVWVACDWTSDSLPAIFEFDGVSTWQAHSISTDSGYDYFNAFSMMVAADSSLWIGEEGEITHLKNGHWSNWNISSEIDDYVFGLTEDSIGGIWATNTSGLDYYDGTIWQQRTTGGAKPNGFFPLSKSRGIVLDGTTLWVTGYESEGLAKLSDTGWTVFGNLSNNPLRSEQPKAMTRDSKGRYWFGMRDRGEIDVFDGTNWSNYDSLAYGSDVVAMAADSSGNVWIGTVNGLVKFDGTHAEQIDMHTVDTFSNVIYALMWDERHHSLWVGNGWEGNTGDHSGVARFDGTTWTTWLYPDVYPQVSAFDMDTEGNIWAAPYQYGIYEFDGNNWHEFHPSNSGLPNNNVEAIVSDRKGGVWAATDGGAGYWNGSSWQAVTSSNIVPYLNASTLDSYGNVWLAGGGASAFDGKNWIAFTTSNSSIGDVAIWSAMAGSNGILWCGTSGQGLLEFIPSSPASVAPVSLEPTPNFTIYPNPTISILHIVSTSSDITITDLLGRIWLHSNNAALDVSGLPQGVYSISDGKSRAQFVKE